MSFSPIAFISPNFRDFKNDYLKAYEPGTTTPKVIALDSAGAVQVAKLQLNADGFIISAGNAIVIPYIDGAYDLWLFPTEAEADANDTSNAERLADNLSAPGSELINDLSQAYIFDTKDLMVASLLVFPLKKVLSTNEDVSASYIVTAASEKDGDVQLADGKFASFRYLTPDSTVAEKTWNVSTTGSDLNGDGSIGSPFLSIQRAVDAIPTNVKHRQVIQLADGVHVAGSRNTNPIGGASTVRVVRVLVDNKNVNGRDMLVIQGNLTDKSLTTIQHNDVYSAVYVEETNGVVIKDLTIDCALNPAATVSVFQHRRGDMRIVDVTLLGNDFDGAHAILAETGGFIEHAGDIVMTKYERGMVALDAVISFIGDSITHDGGTATAPRTFEAGNNGQIDVFSGTLTVTNVQRLVFAKDARVLLSPSSSTVSASGFILDADKTAQIEARRIIATGAARAVSCAGGHVLINLCTFTDQTTSAVVGTDGSVIIIDDCSLIDNTNTKAIVDVESCTLIVKGDGDIQGGFRGIFTKNSIVQIDNKMNFLGNSTCIDARQCELKLKGTSGNPITFGTYVNNALFLEGGSCSMTQITITQPAAKTAVIANGTSIVNEGGVNIDGGFRGFDLEQNASLSAESTTGSDLTNMSEGINARRGSQVNYRASSMDFTGTGTPTVDSAAQFSLVSSF